MMNDKVIFQYKNVPNMVQRLTHLPSRAALVVICKVFCSLIESSAKPASSCFRLESTFNATNRVF